MCSEGGAWRGSGKWLKNRGVQAGGNETSGSQRDPPVGGAVRGLELLGDSSVRRILAKERTFSVQHRAKTILTIGAI